MLPDEFDKRVRRVMSEKQAWFEGVEAAADESDVERVESELGYRLPVELRHFALEFGGGYFGGINISTLNRKSPWYILSRPSVKVDDEPMLVISDDEAGGYYGFLLNRGSFDSRIIYVNPDDGNHREEAATSFFEFVEKFALSL